jgi:putative addiction module CopG family antidote
MNIAIGDRWQGVIAQAVESGRFASPEDVVAEAMHLLAERERKFQALKASIEAALADPREVSEAEMDAAIADQVARLKAEGYE